MRVVVGPYSVKDESLACISGMMRPSDCATRPVNTPTSERQSLILMSRLAQGAIQYEQ